MRMFCWSIYVCVCLWLTMLLLLIVGALGMFGWGFGSSIHHISSYVCMHYMQIGSVGIFTRGSSSWCP